MGVSVETRKYLWRLVHLRRTAAHARFVSFEPLLEWLGQIDLRDIHWVIVGGESGPSARPMDKSWVGEIRDQCLAAGVPFLFKQWGGTNNLLA
jgi:protein gp37